MSIQIKDGTRLKVKKVVEVKSKYAVVHLSSSRKDKQTDRWVYSNWGFARMVWHAHEKMLSLEVGEGDVIEVVSGTVSFEPYGDDYKMPKNPAVTIFDFEIYKAASKKEKVELPLEDEIPDFMVDEEEPSFE